MFALSGGWDCARLRRLDVATAICRLYEAHTAARSLLLPQVPAALQEDGAVHSDEHDSRGHSAAQGGALLLGGSLQVAALFSQAAD